MPLYTFESLEHCLKIAEELNEILLSNSENEIRQTTFAKAFKFLGDLLKDDAAGVEQAILYWMDLYKNPLNIAQPDFKKCQLSVVSFILFCLSVHYQRQTALHQRLLGKLNQLLQHGEVSLKALKLNHMMLIGSLIEFADSFDTQILAFEILIKLLGNYSESTQLSILKKLPFYSAIGRDIVRILKLQFSDLDEAMYNALSMYNGTAKQDTNLLSLPCKTVIFMDHFCFPSPDTWHASPIWVNFSSNPAALWFIGSLGEMDESIQLKVKVPIDVILFFKAVILIYCNGGITFSSNINNLPRAACVRIAVEPEQIPIIKQKFADFKVTFSASEQTDFAENFASSSQQNMPAASPLCLPNVTGYDDHAVLESSASMSDETFETVIPNTHMFREESNQMFSDMDYEETYISDGEESNRDEIIMNNETINKNFWTNNTKERNLSSYLLGNAFALSANDDEMRDLPTSSVTKHSVGKKTSPKSEKKIKQRKSKDFERVEHTAYSDYSENEALVAQSYRSYNTRYVTRAHIRQKLCAKEPSKQSIEVEEPEAEAGTSKKFFKHAMQLRRSKRLQLKKMAKSNDCLSNPIYSNAKLQTLYLHCKKTMPIEGKKPVTPKKTYRKLFSMEKHEMEIDRMWEELKRGDKN